VRIGVTLKLLGVVVHFFGVIISIGVIVPVAVNGVRNQKDRPLNPEDIAPAAAGAATIVIFIALIATGLSLAGYGFCLAAPEKHGAKTLAIVVLTLGVLAFVPVCLAIIIPVANLATTLIELVESFLFLFFLRALARCLDSRDLEDRIGTAMRLLGSTIGWFVTIPVMIVLLIALGVIDSKDQLTYVTAMCLLGGFFCIGCILGLAYMIWLIWALAEARYEIGYYLDRNY
jgi:hypothetical protein